MVWIESLRMSACFDRLVNVLIVVALSVVLPANSGLASSEPGSDRPSALVLVTIDTLRADHLGCYGYPRPTSPFVDELAAGGFVFERAFAMSATTAPSHASLLTGTYPLQHGILKNGHKLPEGILTMAEAFRGAGFATGGFVSTRVHFRHGRMNRGFDDFDEAPLPTSPQDSLPGTPKRPAAGTIDKALDWIEKLDAQKPFFLWVHLFDPHTPYVESNVLTVEGEDPEQILDFYRRRHSLDTPELRHNPRAVLRRMSLYDGEIRYADRELRRLFDRVAARTKTQPGGALWILTSDHGEGLGNHDWLSHGKKIYNEQIRVPLIFWFSSGVPVGRRIRSVVEHVDVLPTVADLLRVDLTEATAIQGESFLPLLFDETAHRSKGYAFSQRRIFDFRPEETPVPNYESGMRYSLQDDRYKYIHWTDGADEFYDISTDPYEARNLIGRGIPEEERMRRALLHRVNSLVPISPKSAQPTPGEVIQERLRALGYIP